MSDATRGQPPGPNADRLARVFALYHRRLHGYVVARLGRSDWHLADDLTSEVFVRVVKNLPQCRVPEDRMFSWLATIARHLIADHYRLARNTRETATDFSDWSEARVSVSPSAEGTAMVRIEARSMLASRPAVASPAVKRQVEALAALAVAA